MSQAIPKHFYKLSLFRFLFSLIWVYALIFVGWYVCSKQTSGGIWVICLLLTGVLQNHLGNLLHDAYHYRISSTRWVNELIARWFLAAPLTIPLTSGRHSHLTHHKLLGKEEDPDTIYYGNKDKSTELKFILFLAKLFSGIQYIIVGLKVLSSSKKSNVTQSSRVIILDVIAVIISQLVLIAVSYFVFNSVAIYIFLWIIPLITILVGLNSLRSFCEHIEYSRDDWSITKERLYTIVSNPVERYIVSPFNMNFHAEHHLAVGIPFYRLPSFRVWLEKNNKNNYVYRKSYITTIRQYLASLPI